MPRPSIHSVTFINKLRRACPQPRAGSLLFVHGAQTEKQSADHSPPIRPTLARGFLSICDYAARDAAHPLRATPTQAPNPPPQSGCGAPISSLHAETPSSAVGPASRLDQFGDRRSAGRLDPSAGKLGSSIPHGRHECLASTLGDSLPQRSRQLLLFLQRKPVGCIEGARIRCHGENLRRHPDRFQSITDGQPVIP